MFLARTSDNDLFVEQLEELKKKRFLSDQHFPSGIKKALKEEIQKHRVVKLNIKDQVFYYLHNIFGPLFVCGHFCWPNKERIVKMIDEA